MAIEIPESVRAVLAKSPSSHLVTVNPDGSPQVTLANPILAGDEIQICHMKEHQKVKNIRRDPRVVLSIEPGTTDEHGLDLYVVIHGRARITEGGGADVVNTAVRARTGDPTAVLYGDGPEAGYVNHIVIERITGVGPWGRKH